MSRCLVVTFRAGLYRYKHKTTLFNKVMFFKMLLLQLLSSNLILLLTMVDSDVTVLTNNTSALRQDRVLVKFSDHTYSNFTLFVETFQEFYDIVIKIADLDALWVDHNDKRNSKPDAFNTLNDKSFENVKKQFENKYNGMSTLVVRNIKKLLQDAKLLCRREDSGRIVIICDANNLASFFANY